MYFVYILRSERDENFYIGFTANLNARLNEHKNGNVTSTKHRRPLRLIFYEVYINKYDALRREKYFKTTKGKTTLRSMLRKYLTG
jgi:putative endonuclease